MSYILAAKHDRRLYSLLKVQKHLIKARLSTRDADAKAHMNTMLADTENLIKEAQDKAPYQTELASDYRDAEGILSLLRTAQTT
jgi:hypothetical protein